MSDNIGMGSISFTSANEATSVRPTMRLRFVDGRLQQGFEIERYRGCFPYSREIEWRDVPNVVLADAPPKPIIKEKT